MPRRQQAAPAGTVARFPRQAPEASRAKTHACMRWARSVKVARPADGGAPGLGKSVLIVLASYADEHGHCYPSQATIAEDTQLSERSVRDWCKELERQGLIKRKRRHKRRGERTSDLIMLQLHQEGLPAQCAGGELAPTGTVLHPYRHGAPSLPAQRAGELPVEQPEEGKEPAAAGDLTAAAAGGQAASQQRELPLLRDFQGGEAGARPSRREAENAAHDRLNRDLLAAPGIDAGDVVNWCTPDAEQRAIAAEIASPGSGLPLLLSEWRARPSKAVGS